MPQDTRWPAARAAGLMTLVWREVPPETLYVLTASVSCSTEESQVPAVVGLHTSATVGLDLISLLASSSHNPLKPQSDQTSFQKEAFDS